VLAAFASFLYAMVVTLPAILFAGVIALAGLWLINNVDLTRLDTLTFERSHTAPSTDGSSRAPRSTTGQGSGETTGNSR